MAQLDSDASRGCIRAAIYDLAFYLELVPPSLCSSCSQTAIDASASRSCQRKRHRQSWTRDRGCIVGCSSKFETNHFRKHISCFLFQGWLWHGYEVIGLDKIPDKGPALLIYYHGALPLDYYYLVAKTVLHRRRIIHSVRSKT